MRFRILGVILICGTMLVGCVTKSTHVATLTELEQAQKALTKLEADKTKLSNDLLSAQTVAANTQRDLDRATVDLNQALAAQKKIEEDLRMLQAKANDLEQKLQAEKATVARL